MYLCACMYLHMYDIGIYIYHEYIRTQEANLQSFNGNKLDGRQKILGQ